MDALSKLRETALSVLPVMGLVVILGLLAVPEGAAEPFWLVRFILGGALLVAGLSMFLLGVDLGIEPFGERVGEALAFRRSLPWLVASAAIVGVAVTAAEPDVQVFASQVAAVAGSVSKEKLVWSIAAGVGAFMALGMLRGALSLGLKPSLCLGYALLSCLAIAAPSDFLGIAFDAGGATTGPMTVPFVMALGLGLAGARNASGKRGDSGFGLTGIASIGPVAAVLALALALGAGADDPSDVASAPAATSVAEVAACEAALCKSVFSPFVSAAGHTLSDAAISISPLLALLALFRLTILRMTVRQLLRTAIGLAWALLGLWLLLLGVEGGFGAAGEILGSALGRSAAGSPAATALLVAVGAAFGAIVVCAEPAVWVLGDKVEEFSGGVVRRKALLFFLACSTALAIGLAMVRAVFGFPLWYLLLPGYATAFALLAVVPVEWTAIAFDSGGVASGPLTTTFVLSFALGAAQGAGGRGDLFGVVALVAMAPLVAVQFLGLLVERRRMKSEVLPS